MDLRKIDYEGTVSAGGREFYLRRAGTGDIAALGRMYKDCAIHSGNYKERLDPANDSSFQRKGGMFLIMETGDIKRELSNPHSFWAVIADEGGTPCGSFWFGDTNPDMSGCQKQADTVYPREIIVSGEFAGLGLGRHLYRTVLRAMFLAGYQRGICDVYCTVAYEAGGERRPVNLLNKPSFTDLLLLGAAYKGPSDMREIILPGLKVWVEPQVFCLDMEKILRNTNGW